MSDWSSTFHLVSRALESVPVLMVPYLRLVSDSIPYKLRNIVLYIKLFALLYCFRIFSRIVFHNDIYLYYLSTFVTFMLLSTTYHKLFESSVIKKSIIIAQFVFIIIAFVEAVWINEIFTKINSYSQWLSSCILIVLALLHLAAISVNKIDLSKQPAFYFSTAILIYFPYIIITYVTTTIIYSSGYDKATTIQLDQLISAPDALLYAVHMGLLAWMFSFFPLSVNPRRALPYWLHYSRWKQAPYKLLGNKIL